MKKFYQYIIEKLKIDKDIKSQDKDSNDPNTWDEGDILSGTFCYNMTIPYFYKVIKKTAKTFTLIELPKKLASGHYNGLFSEVPDDSKEPKAKPKTVRINKWGSLFIGRVHLHLWDGKPVEGDDMD